MILQGTKEGIVVAGLGALEAAGKWALGHQCLNEGQGKAQQNPLLLLPSVNTQIHLPAGRGNRDRGVQSVPDTVRGHRGGHLPDRNQDHQENLGNAGLDPDLQVEEKVKRANTDLLE